MGRVRKEAPSPKVGELPLPSGAASLPAAQLEAFPQWGDLPWPKGAAPPPPVPDARGVLQFKVGGGLAGDACWPQRAPCLDVLRASVWPCLDDGLYSRICEYEGLPKSPIQAYADAHYYVMMATCFICKQNFHSLCAIHRVVSLSH